MVFHRSLSDIKSPLKCPWLLSVFWPFSIMQLLGWSPLSRQLPVLYNNPLVAVPKTPITICTIVTLMFHISFNSLARSRYLSFFSHSFSFILKSAGTAKSTILHILFFFLLLIIIRSGRRAEIRWFVCMSKFHRSLCVSFSRTGRVFHISFSWWIFTGVWVIASLLKSPGLFSVYWPFSKML